MAEIKLVKQICSYACVYVRMWIVCVCVCVCIESGPLFGYRIRCYGKKEKPEYSERADLKIGGSRLSVRQDTNCDEGWLHAISDDSTIELFIRYRFPL